MILNKVMILNILVGENGKLNVGEMLGQMKPEHDGYEIVEFVSGGSKQYGLMLRRLSDGKIFHKLRLRGITLNVGAKNVLSYDSFKNSVLNYCKENPHLVAQKRFVAKKSL